MRFFIYVIIFLVVASCSNTSIYNRTVTQGTVFKQDDIDRLEIGMSKDQVSFIMGQPSFQNIFDENVWDYYFQVKNGAQIQSEKKLKLLFDENGDLKEIKVIQFDHKDVVRHPLVSKIIRAYQKKSTDDKN